MSEHTELPWQGPLSLRDCKDRNAIDDADGRTLLLIVGITVQSRGERKRVGDALVRICNSHEKLLAACEWINAFIATASDGGDAWCAIRNQPGAKEWAKNLDAAIKKAQP